MIFLLGAKKTRSIKSGVLRAAQWRHKSDCLDILTWKQLEGVEKHLVG